MLSTLFGMAIVTLVVIIPIALVGAIMYRKEAE